MSNDITGLWCLGNRNFRRGLKRIAVGVPVFGWFWKDDMGEVVLKVHKELIRYYLKQKNSSESKGNVVLEERVKAIRYYFLSKIIVK